MNPDRTQNGPQDPGILGADASDCHRDSLLACQTQGGDPGNGRKSTPATKGNRSSSTLRIAGLGGHLRQHYLFLVKLLGVRDEPRSRAAMQLI